MAYFRLESLSSELILAIMKFLPTFHDLNSFTRTNKFLSLMFKLNHHGVCSAIARSQYHEMWDDANNFLQYGRRSGQLCHEPRIPVPPPRASSESSPTHQMRLQKPRQSLPSSAAAASDDYRGRFRSHEKCCKKPSGIGIFEGGTKIGFVEAKMLIKFSKRSLVWRDMVTNYIFMGYRYYPWEYVRHGHGIPISDTPIPGICSITKEQSNRIDRALLRYYLLLLACAPDWVEERKNYHLLFLEYNLSPGGSISSIGGGGEDEPMTHSERIENKTQCIEPFLRYRGRDLSDIYVVSRATAGCRSQLPGTVEQGADHIYERWTNIDDSCVQQRADIYIKRAWEMTEEDPERLMDSDLFFS